MTDQERYHTFAIYKPKKGNLLIIKVRNPQVNLSEDNYHFSEELDSLLIEEKSINHYCIDTNMGKESIRGVGLCGLVIGIKGKRPKSELSVILSDESQLEKFAETHVDKISGIKIYARVYDFLKANRLTSYRSEYNRIK